MMERVKSQRVKLGREKKYKRKKIETNDEYFQKRNFREILESKSCLLLGKMGVTFDHFYLNEKKQILKQNSQLIEVLENFFEIFRKFLEKYSLEPLNIP